MSLLLSGLLVTVGAAVTTALLVPLVSRLASSGGLTAAVRPDRWHERPVPTTGGIAIVAGFAVGAGLYALVTDGLPSAPVSARALVEVSPITGLIAAVLFAAVVGLVDDLVPLRPLTKLAGQFLAAGALLAAGIGVWLTGIYLLDVFISLFWFVGITNALNLLDNMDGVAAGVAIIAAVFIGITLVLDGQSGFALLAFAFAGSIGGFLVHNYPPARVFMGDSGSLFLGMSLAGFALSPSPGLSRSLFAVVIVPAAILAIPILDTTFVTVSRLLEGRPISRGGKDHTSHGLVGLGLSSTRAMWVLWGLASLGGLVGLLIRTSGRGTASLLGGALLVFLSLLGLYLLTARVDAEDEGHAGLSTSLFARLVAVHHQIPVLALVLDMVLVGLAYYAAYLVRWDPDRLPAELVYFRQSVAVVIVGKLAAFTLDGLYRTNWRHAGLWDAMTVARANLLGSVAVGALLFFVAPIGLSRGVLITDFMLCVAFTGAARFSFRWMESKRAQWSVEGNPVAVVGSAREVRLIIEVVRETHRDRLRPVVIVLTDVGAGRRTLQGVPVVYGLGGMRRAVRRRGVQSAILLNSGSGTSAAKELVDEYLQTEGALEVHAVKIDLV